MDPLTAGFNALEAFFRFLCTPVGQEMAKDVHDQVTAGINLLTELSQEVKTRGGSHQ